MANTELKIKMLKDSKDTNFLPFSTSKAVFIDGTDKTVDSKLTEIEAAIPTKTSDLTNDSNFVTSSELPYQDYSASRQYVTMSDGVYKVTANNLIISYYDACVDQYGGQEYHQDITLTKGDIITIVHRSNSYQDWGTSQSVGDVIKITGSINKKYVLKDITSPSTLFGDGWSDYNFSIEEIEVSKTSDLVNDSLQPTLVSGTNIKTINNQSILGSGDISISGSSTNKLDFVYYENTRRPERSSYLNSLIPYDLDGDGTIVTPGTDNEIYLVDLSVCTLTHGYVQFIVGEGSEEEKINLEANDILIPYHAVDGQYTVGDNVVLIRGTVLTKYTITGVNNNGIVTQITKTSSADIEHVHHITANGQNKLLFSSDINVNDIVITRDFILDGTIINSFTFPIGTLFFFKYNASAGPSALAAPGLIIMPTGEMYQVTELAALVITGTTIGTVGGGGSESTITIKEVLEELPSDTTNYSDGDKVYIVNDNDNLIYTLTSGTWTSSGAPDSTKLYLILNRSDAQGLVFTPGIYKVDTSDLYNGYIVDKLSDYKFMNGFNDVYYMKSGTYLADTASSFAYYGRYDKRNDAFSNPKNIPYQSLSTISAYKADDSTLTAGDVFVINDPKNAIVLTLSSINTTTSTRYIYYTWSVKNYYSALQLRNSADAPAVNMFHLFKDPAGSPTKTVLWILDDTFTLEYTEAGTQESKSFTFDKGDMVQGNSSDCVSGYPMIIYKTNGKRYKITDLTVVGTYFGVTEIGGVSPEVAVSTTEPTGDEKIWINPNETPSGIGSYISNTYGESQAIGYSQEYVNGELTKKQEKLEVKSYTKNVGVIGAGVDYVSNIALESGYTYLGIVGIALSGGFYTFLNVTSNYIYGNTATTVLHNSANQQTDAITMIIYVLRYKN